MSKVVLGSVALGLNGAVIAGGGWLIHTGIQKGKVDADLVDSLEKFKANGKDEGCVTSLFGDLGSLPTTGASTGTVATENIEATWFETNKKTDGCLVVNWDKENYGDNWKGNIRFLWAVKGENNKGFIVYLLGTADNGSGTQAIKWTGVAYALTGTLNENRLTWAAKSNQDVASSGDKKFKQADNSADNTFPRAGTALGLGENKNFWGFFNSSADLAKICASEGTPTCTGAPTKTQFRGYWDWTGQEGAENSQSLKTLADWTQDLATWWSSIFDNAKFKANELVSKQKGTWTARVKLPEPSTSSKA